MSEAYLGEIRLVPYNFAPTGWALCQGQLLPISQNTALFSLLGTTYGGNGQSTFALPDLQGRTPVGIGQGPGLSPYDQGQVGGTETVTLNINELPPHNHAIRVSSGTAASQNPVGAHLGATSAATKNTYAPTPTGNMAADSLSIVGQTQPHSNMQPYLTLNYIIAIAGIFPPRP